MSFRVPVATQEPVPVVSRRVPNILNTRLYLTGAMLTSSNPYLWRYTVPQGAAARPIALVVRWFQSAANQQTFAITYNNTGPDTGSVQNQVWASLRCMINANAAAVHQLVSHIGGGRDVTTVANGVATYTTEYIPLPDIELDQGYSVRVGFYDALAGDDAYVYFAYEERTKDV